MKSDLETMIRKASTKPLPPEKARELLLKVRKGATSTLTLTSVVQLGKLVGGWEVKPTVGWVSRHFAAPDVRGGFVLELETAGTRDEIMAIWERAKAAEVPVVDDMPTVPPAVGKIVTAEVGQPYELTGHKPWTLMYKKWTGAEGVEVTGPRGEKEVFLPNRYNLRPDGRGPGVDRDVVSWISKKGGPFIADVNRFLEMEAHEPAAPRTRENTGTCPACFGNYKLRGQVLVIHGYTRPGWGYVRGECFGVGMHPLETASYGAMRFLSEKILPIYQREKKTLARVEAGEVREILLNPGEEDPKKRRWVKEGDPMFDVRLGEFRSHLKREVERMEDDVKLYEKIIAAWRLRPMPEEGEPTRGPKFFTK